MMLPLSRPVLFSHQRGRYDCPDLRSLYHWLEAHGYHYYGSFSPAEYGRFACTELALGEAGPIAVSSTIEVHLNGLVVAVDERAMQLLDELVSHIAFRSPPDVPW